MVYNKKRTYRKKTYRKRTKATVTPNKPKYAISANLGSFGTYGVSANFKRSIKAIVDGDKECKRKIVAPSGVTMKQSTHYNRNILGNIAKGNTVFERESDQIHLCALKGSMYVGSVWATGTFETFLRVMLIRTQAEHSSATDAWSSALGSGDLYLNSTLPTQPIQGLLDPKKVQTLFDKTITFKKQPGTNTNLNAQLIDFNIPLNFDYTYKNGSNHGSKYNLQWVVISYSAGATTGTTDTCFVDEVSQLLFKDL